MSVYIITGAASGLGWELAQRVFAQGHELVMTDMNEQLLAQRGDELNDAQRVVCVAGDITDDTLQQTLLAQTQTSFGRLDVLINNAGITHRSRVADTDPAVFAKVMAVDWQAPVKLCCQALPLLRASRGQIINIGSMAGWMPVPGRAAYCAAKSALAQFFEVLRIEVEDQGIRVLNVYPSFLDTPIEHNALGADGQPAKHARSTVGVMRDAGWMAERILNAQARGKAWIFGDRLSWFGSVLWRVWPARYLRIVRKRFAVELSA